MGRPTKVDLTARFPERLWERLTVVAHRLGWSKTRLIEVAVREFVEREECEHGSDAE